jgi:hypothetical protein
MTVRVMRFLGALAILAVGAVHLQQYIAGYGAIPTVGTLFMLNTIASGIVGIALLVPMERVSAVRRPDAAIGMLALAGVAIAVGSLVALFISESGSLFGFSESGYRTPIVVAIIAEAATLALLAPVSTVTLARAGSRHREATMRRRASRDSRPDYSAAR